MIKTIERRDDHTYWYTGREFPAVSRVLDAVGFKGFYKQTATGAPRGTAVHKAIADYLTGEIITDWVDLATKAEKCLAFHKIEIEAVEAVGGLQLPDIAGTADLVGIMDGEKAIVDWKTGKYDQRHFFQLQLYCHIWGAPVGLAFYVDAPDAVSGVRVPYDKTIAETILSWYYIKQTRGKI